MQQTTWLKLWLPMSLQYPAARYNSNAIGPTVYSQRHLVLSIWITWKNAFIICV
jgi:hypothetical protein